MKTAWNLKVLVVGGGIGGLTVAHALRREGIAVTVFERAQNIERAQYGSGFFLWSNAMAALKQLDLADAVTAVGAPIRRFEEFTARGEQFANWPVDEMSAPAGVPSICISRADLHPVLLDRLGEGMVELGAECTGFEQDATGVTAHIAGGRTERGDLLIGADGVRSITRDNLRRQASPRYAGYTAWHAIIDDAYRDSLGDIFREAWGRGARFIHYPVGHNRRYWAGFLAVPEDFPTPDGARATMFTAFSRWMEPLKALIAATEEEEIHRTPIYTRLPLRHWGEERVTLLGDSAHPMTPNLGQGACQAIEDAVVLAKCLRGLGEGDDIAAALRDYERRRKSRTASVVMRAWGIGETGRWKSGLACTLRDRINRVVFSTVALSQQRKDMTYSV
jgi:2-polyprenyl-6-methoxyphenol hydroxylase-like FAD-dependent oxidoreductase